MVLGALLRWRICPPTQAHRQAETIPLERRVVRLGVRGVALVVAAGILSAALVRVVAGHAEDRADAAGPAEAEGRAPGRVRVVALNIPEEAEAGQGRSLGTARASVGVVPRRIVEHADAAEAATAAAQGQLVGVLAGQVE